MKVNSPMFENPNGNDLNISTIGKTPCSSKYFEYLKITNASGSAGR